MRKITRVRRRGHLREQHATPRRRDQLSKNQGANSSARLMPRAPATIGSDLLQRCATWAGAGKKAARTNPKVVQTALFETAIPVPLLRCCRPYRASAAVGAAGAGRGAGALPWPVVGGRAGATGGRARRVIRLEFRRGLELVLGHASWQLHAFLVGRRHDFEGGRGERHVLGDRCRGSRPRRSHRQGPCRPYRTGRRRRRRSSRCRRPITSMPLNFVASNWSGVCVGDELAGRWSVAGVVGAAAPAATAGAAEIAQRRAGQRARPQPSVIMSLFKHFSLRIIGKNPIGDVAFLLLGARSFPAVESTLRSEGAFRPSTLLQNSLGTFTDTELNAADGRRSEVLSAALAHA